MISASVGSVIRVPISCLILTDLVKQAFFAAYEYVSDCVECVIGVISNRPRMTGVYSAERMLTAPGDTARNSHIAAQ